MRKSKKITIDDKKITVYELRVKDVRKLISAAENIETDFTGLKEVLPAVTDLSIADLDNLAPSELKTLWDAFKEVNADFFALLEKSGIVKVLKDSMGSSLTGSFAEYLKQAMSTSGNTDGDSSSPP